MAPRTNTRTRPRSNSSIERDRNPASIERELAQIQRQTELIQQLTAAKQAKSQAQALLDDLEDSPPPNPPNLNSRSPSRAQWKPKPPDLYKGGDQRLLDTYLYQCRTAFALDGAPQAGNQRVSWALQYLEEYLGRQWLDPALEYNDDEAWDAYTEFLQNDVKPMEIRDAEYRVKLDKAQQLDWQTPRNFDRYLSVIESKLPHPSGTPDEVKRVKGERFFYKLTSKLRNLILAHDHSPDLRRDAIVLTASRLWLTLPEYQQQKGHKRGQSDATQQQQRNPRKRQDRSNNLPDDSGMPPSGRFKEPDPSNTRPWCDHHKYHGHATDDCYVLHPEKRPKDRKPWDRRVAGEKKESSSGKA